MSDDKDEKTIETLVEKEKQQDTIVLEEVKSENMDREKENKKCCVMKNEVHACFKCCTYSWCITLNGIECCCMALSSCCIAMSNVAICCNKMLEQIDCDQH